MTPARSSSAPTEPLRFALAAVFVLTLAAFLPALGGGFLSGFDDGFNLLDNPAYRGFGARNLLWMFTSAHGRHYHPLTWLTFALDHQFWGMAAFGYHLTSVVIHALNAALFALVARRLFAAAGLERARAATAALLAALFFALHPLRVESVAWLSERRDVVSGFFYLLTILIYLSAQTRAAGEERARLLLWAAAAYAASLLGKAIGVTLPLALLVLDVYPLRRRLTAGVLAEKIPLLAIAAAFGLLALYAEIPNGALTPLADLSLGARAAVAAYAAVFYLAKTIAPVGLLPLYPLPASVDPLSPLFAASFAAFAALCATAWLARRVRPALAAAWVFYVITLLPVSGLIRIGPTLAADRYTYLSCLGWALLAGALLARLERRRALALGGLIAAVLGAATWAQAGVWRDERSLWTYVLSVSPDHAPAEYHLGRFCMEVGRAAQDQRLMTEAAEHFRAAVRLDPTLAPAYNDLGNALSALGDQSGALAAFLQALALAPDAGMIHFNIGRALESAGRRDEAAAQYRLELSRTPDSELAREALSRVAPSAP